MSYSGRLLGPRLKIVLSVSVALLALSSTAYAQRETERSAAEALFAEGRELLAQGKYPEARAKFSTSYRLDPGLGALLNLGLCYKKNGQTASAWSTFREAAMLARNAGEQARENVARQEAGELEPKVGRLRILVPTPLSTAPGLEVRLDEAPLPIAALTSALPVDAGEHEVQVSATGKRPWHGKVTSHDAAEVILRVPQLADQPVSLAAGAPHATETSTGTTQRITALAVGGLGMVALGVGGFYALSAQSSDSDANSYCSKSGVCSAKGVALGDDAKSKARTSTLFVGAGAAALVGATVLWFTAPSPPSRSEPKRAGVVHIRPYQSAWGVEVGATW